MAMSTSSGRRSRRVIRVGPRSALASTQANAEQVLMLACSLLDGWALPRARRDLRRIDLVGNPLAHAAQRLDGVLRRGPLHRRGVAERNDALGAVERQAVLEAVFQAL